MVNKEQNGTCETCRHHGVDDDFGLCDVCIRPAWAKDNYEPLTNAERIRRMTDKELAVVLNRGPIMCERQDGDCESREGFDCRECLLRWLRDPVKEVRDA